eukprot:12890331-Prorocentrum_lima.AAC.1
MSIDCVAALGLVQLVFAAVCEASQITNWPGKEPHDACRSHVRLMLSRLLVESALMSQAMRP